MIPHSSKMAYKLQFQNVIKQWLYTYIHTSENNTLLLPSPQSDDNSIYRYHETNPHTVIVIPIHPMDITYKCKMLLIFCKCVTGGTIQIVLSGVISKLKYARSTVVMVGCLAQIVAYILAFINLPNSAVFGNTFDSSVIKNK